LLPFFGLAIINHLLSQCVKIDIDCGPRSEVLVQLKMMNFRTWKARRFASGLGHEWRLLKIMRGIELAGFILAEDLPKVA
jgi:hypothetical protein